MAEAARTSDASRGRQISRDIVLWPYLRTRRSPLWVGAGIAAIFILATLGLSYAVEHVGKVPAIRFPHLVANLSAGVTGLLIGLYPTAIAYLHFGAVRDLRELRPVLRRGAGDLEPLIAEITDLRTPLRRVVTWAGAAFGVAIALADPRLEVAYAEISFFDPRYLWLVLGNALHVGLGARLFATEIHMTRAYDRLGANDVEIDLLDMRMLAPFARKGQRSVVLWALLSAVFSLYWVLGSAGQVNVIVPFFVVVLVTYAFVTPVAGLRRRIRDAKRAELAHIADALREARRPLLDAGGAGTASSPRVADLVAYHTHIENVREWPFDLPAILRFLLFAGLGVGSWLGGALVEWALDRALG